MVRTTTVPTLPLQPPLMIGKLKRVALCIATTGVFALISIGLLHTKLGRPLLALLPSVSCPIEPASAADIDAARAIPAGMYRDRPAAPVRPALVFRLDETTIEDVASWAARHGIACDNVNRAVTIRSCGAVAPTAIGQPEWFGPAEEVVFQFRERGTLAVLKVTRRGLDVRRSTELTTALSSGLRRALGEPMLAAGESSIRHMSSGPMQAFKEEFAFSDYQATLRQVRLGRTGVMVTETYFSATP